MKKLKYRKKGNGKTITFNSNTEYYKKDYINSTEKLLSKPVSYNEAIKSLESIIESGVFEEKD